MHSETAAARLAPIATSSPSVNANVSVSLDLGVVPSAPMVRLLPAGGSRPDPAEERHCTTYASRQHSRARRALS
ncbi:MAG: hypothetical protein OZ922_11750 [Myxococcales bacterium]|jgi:hypothetical protein|nr:hypothetical protein [Myxococcales bacterium]